MIPLNKYYDGRSNVFSASMRASYCHTPANVYECFVLNPLRRFNSYESVLQRQLAALLATLPIAPRFLLRQRRD